MRRLLTWAGAALAVAALVSLVLAATAGRIGRLPSRPQGAEGRPAGPASPAGAAGPGARRQGPPAGVAVPVQAAAVERRTLQQQATYYGVLEPRTTVRLSVRTTGRVASLRVQAGDRVKAGQELLRLDTAELEAQVAQAQAALSQARARYQRLKEGATPEELQQAEAAVAQAESQLEAARKELERTQLLRSSGAATEQAYDTALSRWQQAEAQLQAARARLDSLKAGPNPNDLAAAQAEVERAQAALRLAQVQLANARLVAPMDGTVAQVTVEVGENASPSAPVLTLVDVDELKVLVRVPGEDALRLREGMAVRVQPRAMPSRFFPGRIVRVDPVADPQSHLFGVEVRLPNRDQVLRAGLDVSVQVPLVTVEGALAVPESAVARWNDQVGIFVIEQGRARFRQVQLGISDGNWREVISGLQEGERVITAGKEFVAPETPVRVSGEEGAR